jgi:hypothetical protein
MFAICNLAIIPLRAEPNDRSEIVSQVLFGEHFEIMETLNQWSKIKLQFDDYEGWVDSKQYQTISEKSFKSLSNDAIILNSDLVEYVTNSSNILLPIPLGSSLSFLNYSEINIENFEFEGMRTSGIKPKSDLISTAFMYLNAPYLWGGKTPFGIDCSGFTQLVFRYFNHNLPRDAYQQAELGSKIDFTDCKPGDLAFFTNTSGKIIHVGIVLENNKIIHASGYVRIDSLTSSGILNEDKKELTHTLFSIQRI